MDSEKNVMLRIVSSAVALASKAGTEIKRITKSGQDLAIIDKGIQDYQTEADRLAQRIIVDNLQRRFPECTIIGEEDLAEDAEASAKLITDSFDPDVLSMSIPSKYENLKEKDITIWVDPLDGTKEFVRGGFELVTVLIGLSVGGRSVAGVVHQPFYKDESRTIWAIDGLGCFGVTAQPAPSDKLILTTTASHGNQNIEDALTAIKPDKVIRVGGAGYKVLLVIDGEAHGYVFPSAGSKRWDTCAPEAVIEAAGGKMTDSLGNAFNNEYRPDNNYQNYLGIVAAQNSQIHSKLINEIPSAVKNRLIGMPAKL